MSAAEQLEPLIESAEKTTLSVVPAVTATEDSLEKARIEERNRFTREESLRRELEDTKKKLELVKKNGWDLELLTNKKPTPSENISSTNYDATKKIEELERKFEEERNLRHEMQELQAIIDFTHKNSKYELINQLEDAPKYVLMAMREHEKNTGKRISYEEACDYIEEKIETTEKSRVDKFAKTKKGEAIYGINKKTAEQTRTASSTPNVKTTPQAQAPVEPSNLYKSNSKEAFHFFKKQRGF